MGHLPGINDDISHHEPTDEYGAGNNPRDPRIVFSKFDLPHVTRNQFIDPTLRMMKHSTEVGRRIKPSSPLLRRVSNNFLQPRFLKNLFPYNLLSSNQ